jgi:hypothetical protein
MIAACKIVYWAGRSIGHASISTIPRAMYYCYRRGPAILVFLTKLNLKACVQATPAHKKRHRMATHCEHNIKLSEYVETPIRNKMTHCIILISQALVRKEKYFQPCKPFKKAILPLLISRLLQRLPLCKLYCAYSITCNVINP